MDIFVYFIRIKIVYRMIRTEFTIRTNYSTTILISCGNVQKYREIVCKNNRSKLVLCSESLRGGHRFI